MRRISPSCRCVADAEVAAFCGGVPSATPGAPVASSCAPAELARDTPRRQAPASATCASAQSGARRPRCADAAVAASAAARVRVRPSTLLDSVAGGAKRFMFSLRVESSRMILPPPLRRHGDTARGTGLDRAGRRVVSRASSSSDDESDRESLCLILANGPSSAPSSPSNGTAVGGASRDRPATSTLHVRPLPLQAAEPSGSPRWRCVGNAVSRAEPGSSGPRRTVSAVVGTTRSAGSVNFAAEDNDVVGSLCAPWPT
mmetsp:Transcript_8326/g.25701  ORF Transcript_8326/g.25701 Transcript_8326/m.25701 type:complete len:258 (-) Transcript_8326:80-853(-)